MDLVRVFLVALLAACSFDAKLGASSADDAPEPDAAGDASIDAPLQAPACADLALGSDHSCALRDANVYCWGSTSFGVRGGASQTTAVALPPTVHLASSKYTNCAAAMDGTVRCWGNNDAGQLGRGTVGGSSATPMAVMGMTGAVQAGAGRSQACARRADGTIRCWGANGEGQLGDGTTTPHSTAVSDVLTITSAVDFAFTSSHVCARDAAGAAKCWGSNSDGELGDGSTTNRPTPIDAPVSGVSWIGTASYSTGTESGAQTCAIVGGTVQCWGDNAFGQLGNGTTTDSPTPVTAANVLDAVQLAMGRWHVCARHATGRVSCWGRNAYGEVGDGTQAVRSAPFDVGLTDVVELDAGGWHTCALTASKAFYCWGLNTSGQLGITGTLHTTPQQSFALCP